jgi:hypothetical protein
MISDEKLAKYLLAPRKRPPLKDDLRNQVLPRSASLVDGTEYGRRYEIRARLKGPNGKTLPVCTIWMVEKPANVTKFITMYLDRR